MAKLCLLALLVALFVAGCDTPPPSGSREYVPGQGWVPTK